MILNKKQYTENASWHCTFSLVQAARFPLLALLTLGLSPAHAEPTSRCGSSHTAAGSASSSCAIPERLGDLKTQWQWFFPRQDRSASAVRSTAPPAYHTNPSRGKDGQGVLRLVGAACSDHGHSWWQPIYPHRLTVLICKRWTAGLSANQ